MSSRSQAPADPAPDNSLANRYGRPQSSRPSFPARWGKWIAAGAIAAAVALAVWITAATNAQTLDWKDVGYNIKSPTQASVTFQLTKDYEDTVECAIQVLSENYAVVGWRTVTIDPEKPPADNTPSDKTKYYDVNLRTDALGVTGGVNSCWIPDPA
ncbi:DUF4307 domain-containing protein [Citricoccus sp.]|uniref:DUF4307 domain-containing protein n=1 Tax=Citricoccus sp. TaxID=1978372 RepID=UPI0026286CB2|nr:DUF4307 domain-containing protein [Citricoccus sp.]HRO93959.1 DUF4307 domain-containing protein [Citricoccus sp.]